MRRRKAAGSTKIAPPRTTGNTRQNIRTAFTPKYDERQIRAREYEIYLKRNDGAGSTLGDLLQAERELRTR